MTNVEATDEKLQVVIAIQEGMQKFVSSYVVGVYGYYPDPNDINGTPFEELAGTGTFLEEEDGRVSLLTDDHVVRPELHHAPSTFREYEGYFHHGLEGVREGRLLTPPFNRASRADDLNLIRLAPGALANTKRLAIPAELIASGSLDLGDNPLFFIYGFPGQESRSFGGETHSQFMYFVTPGEEGNEHATEGTFDIPYSAQGWRRVDGEGIAMIKPEGLSG